MSTVFKMNFKNLAGMTQGVVEKKTSEIAGRCGPGYKGDVIQTDRPHGAVRAQTPQARRENAKNNTLLKAMHW